MKNVFVLLVLSIFSSYLMFSQNSNWVDMGNYQKLLLDSGNVILSKLNRDETKIFAFTDLGLLKIIDAKTGNLIKEGEVEINFANTNLAKAASFSTNDQYLIICFAGMNKNFTSYDLTVKIFNIDSLNLIFHSILGSLNAGQAYRYYLNSYLKVISDFREFNNDFFICIEEYKREDFGQYGGSMTYGAVYSYFNLIDSIKSFNFYNSNTYKFDFLDSGRNQIFLTESKKDLFPYSDPNHKFDDISTLTYSGKTVYSYNNFNYYNPNNKNDTRIYGNPDSMLNNFTFDKFNRDIYFSLRDNRIFKYSIKDSNYKFLFQPNFSFNNYYIIGNGKYIVFQSNNFVSFYSLENFKLIDTLNITCQNITESISDRSLYFFNGNQVIRMMHKLLSTSLESIFNTDSNKIFVNNTLSFNNFSIGNIKSFKWNFDDGTSSDSINPTHSYSNTGLYTISLIVSDGVIFDTSFKTINVINQIKVDFDTEPIAKIGDIPLSVQFINLSEGDNLSYSWDFGDGQISKEHNPINKYLTYGKWNVSLTAKNEYLSKTITKNSFITTQKPKVDDVSIDITYNNLFDIKGDIIECQPDIDELIIYNILGEEVFINKNRLDTNLNFDDLNLPYGCYFIKAISNQKIEIRKYFNSN